MTKASAYIEGPGGSAGNNKERVFTVQAENGIITMSLVARDGSAGFHQVFHQTQNK